jgi:hypothetical protein
MQTPLRVGGILGLLVGVRSFALLTPHDLSSID